MTREEDRLPSTEDPIIYFNWAMARKAADAAALAGASQLTEVQGSAASLKPAAVNYVNGYACLNGVTDSSSKAKSGARYRILKSQKQNAAAASAAGLPALGG
jgi:hypothetical protein